MFSSCPLKIKEVLMPKSKANARPYNKAEKAGKANPRTSQMDRSMFSKLDKSKAEAKAMTSKVAGKAAAKIANSRIKPGTVKASPRRAMSPRPRGK